MGGYFFFQGSFLNDMLVFQLSKAAHLETFFINL